MKLILALIVTVGGIVIAALLPNTVHPALYHFIGFTTGLITGAIIIFLDY